MTVEVRHAFVAGKDRMGLPQVGRDARCSICGGLYLAPQHRPTARSSAEEYWSTLPDRVLSMQRVFNEIRSHQIERYQATLRVPRFRANARGWVEFAPDTTPTGRWHPTGSRREKALKRETRRLARYLASRLAGRGTAVKEVGHGTFVFDVRLMTTKAMAYARQIGVAWEDVPPHVRAAIERGCRPTRHLRGVIVTWECRCVTAHGDGQGYILPAPPEPAA